jgi:hypothetical protein
MLEGCDGSGDTLKYLYIETLYTLNLRSPVKNAANFNEHILW